MSNPFELGDEVRDVITGFRGTIISKIVYINGCIQYGIKAKIKDGKMLDAEYIDEKQLEITAKRKKKVAPEDPGGLQSDRPK